MDEKAGIEITELKIEKGIQNRWRCETCGKHLPLEHAQLAHRIPQKKHWIKAFGKYVIHHPLNMALTHGGACNDACNLDPSTNPIESEKLVKKILLTLNMVVI